MLASWIGIAGVVTAIYMGDERTEDYLKLGTFIIALKLRRAVMTSALAPAKRTGHEKNTVKADWHGFEWEHGKARKKMDEDNYSGAEVVTAVLGFSATTGMLNQSQSSVQ